MVTKDSSELKTMKIDKKTHKELCDLGGKGETFDTIINRLLSQRKDLDFALKSLSKEDRTKVEEKIKARWEEFI